METKITYDTIYTDDSELKTLVRLIAVKGDKGDDGETPDMSDYYNKDETDNQITVKIESEVYTITDYSTAVGHYSVGFSNFISNAVTNGKKISLVRTYNDVSTVPITITLYAYAINGTVTKNIQFFGWGNYNNKVYLFFERFNTNNRAFLSAYSLVKVIPTEADIESLVQKFEMSAGGDTYTFQLANNTKYYAFADNEAPETLNIITQGITETIDIIDNTLIWWFTPADSTPTFNLSYSHYCTGDGCINGVFTPVSEAAYKISVFYNMYISDTILLRVERWK